MRVSERVRERDYNRNKKRETMVGSHMGNMAAQGF